MRDQRLVQFDSRFAQCRADLVSQIGTAYVRGLEENGIIATLKHFAGYSASKAARNHAPVSIGPREFADYILPPFEYAVRVGRVRSVMNS